MLRKILPQTLRDSLCSGQSEIRTIVILKGLNIDSKPLWVNINKDSWEYVSSIVLNKVSVGFWGVTLRSGELPP